jgi:putative transposase
MMLGQRLRKGMHLKFVGQEYSVEQRLPDGQLQLKHVASENLSAKSEQEILKALFEGAAELLGSNGEVSKLQARREQACVNDFEALEDTDTRKRETLRRFEYVKGVTKHRLTDFGKNAHELKPVVEETSKAINDPKPPACVTLYRWYKDYRASGDDIRVLAPAYKARGKVSENDGRRISDDLQVCQAVDKIIEDVINEYYLALTRPSVQSAFERIEARITLDNQFRNEGAKLPVPHRNTIYRRVSRLDPYEKDQARKGKRIADLIHKVIKQGVRPTRPQERVEMDETKLDYFVWDEKTNLPIGRPWLIIAICVFTKMILGYYLSFARPSYLSVMQCLLHSIRPKTYVRERYPEIVHSWDTYGLPELVVVDNAKQYYSASFDEACLQLGIVTQYAPVRHPYYKPSVERMFGSLNTRLLHQIPGTTFSNIADKWGYDPKKHALISMGNLEQILHNWIVDVYHQSIHRGIGDVPARRWEIGTKEFPPALPFNAEELNVLLGHIEHRSISNSGVEMWGLYYNDPCLSPLKSRHKKGERIKIKYDPMDISLIHVYDYDSNRYLPVPATDENYTRDLTLWQHKVIKREARANAKDYVDAEELCLAKERIQKIVDKQLSSKSKSGSNVKAALWLNIDGKSGGRVEVSEPPIAHGQDQIDLNKLMRFKPEAWASIVGSQPSAAGMLEIGGNEDAITSKATSRSQSIETNPHRSSSSRKTGRREPAEIKASHGTLRTPSTSLKPHEDLILTLDDENDLDSSEFDSSYDLPVRK